MSKQDDELFRAWWPTGDGSPEAAFAAGREVERARVLEIVTAVKFHFLEQPDYEADYSDTCDEITRRIKEQEK